MLNPKRHYLQVALNNTLEDARRVIQTLPYSDRIIIEAGTPLIKRYGMEAISTLRRYWQQRSDPFSLAGNNEMIQSKPDLNLVIKALSGSQMAKNELLKAKSLYTGAYVVADLKCMDRGETEAKLAADAGASAAVVLGSAPIETINNFISACKKLGIDSMLDMMGIDQPIKIMRRLKNQPQVVILHRGVDEASDNKTKTLPINQISKIKGSYNVMISIAGGDTPREVQSAVFNGADIAVVWKDFYEQTDNTKILVENFLKTIK